jgi:hypothetical protein
MTKIQQVKDHLLKKKSITSWQAITLFKATRLSDIIFRLKKKEWVFNTQSVSSKDENGNPETYAKYTLISSGK